jgi:hypothetical protein
VFSIAQIHNFCNFLSNQQQQVFFAPADIDSFLDFYQMALFSKLTGRPEANTGYYPPQKSGVAQDQWANDALTPFKVTNPFLYPDTPGGVLTLPSNYVRLNSLYVQTFSNKNSDIKYSGVQILADDLIPKRLADQINTPTLGDPIGQWIGVTNATPPQYLIQLYPKQPMSGFYTYLKRPPVPLFSFTQVGRVITQDVAASVNLGWNDEVQIQIVMATLQALGINTNDTNLLSISNYASKGGATP